MEILPPTKVKKKKPSWCSRRLFYQQYPTKSFRSKQFLALLLKTSSDQNMENIQYAVRSPIKTIKGYRNLQVLQSKHYHLFHNEQQLHPR